MPLTVRVNAVQSLALAAFGVLLGEWLRRRVPLLERLSMPASVAGGLAYAGVVLLRGRVHLDMDMSGSVALAGGARVVLFLALATAGANALVITAMANWVR